MNEKERIIELVRNNVISMDEALSLLEAAGEADQVTTATGTHKAESVDEQESRNSVNRIEGKVANLVDNVVSQGRNFAKQVGDYFKEENTERDSEMLDQVDEPATESSTWDQVDPVEQETIEAQVADFAEQASQLSAEIDRLNASLVEKQEQLTITQQRLRELEVFSELDNLTEDMQAQKIDLELKESELEGDVSLLEAQLADLEVELDLIYQSTISDDLTTNFEDYIRHNAENIGRSAQDFGRDAAREGRRFGGFVRQQVRNFMDNFNTKEVQVNFTVPWLKSETITHQFVYEAEDLSEIQINTVSGDLRIESHDSDQVIIGCDIQFLGNHEEVSTEAFLANNEISLQAGKLVIDVNKHYGFDATIKLPARHYQALNLQLTNGDLTLQQLDLDRLYIKATNGDLDVHDLVAHQVDLDFVNGDIEIYQSQIVDMTINNVNGDFRIQGPVANIKAETVNGDYYLTKLDDESSQLEIKTMTGDLKLSLPINLDLSADNRVSLGDIRSRLSSITREEILDNGRRIIYDRNHGADTSVQVKFTTRTGDIYLKDSDPS